MEILHTGQLQPQGEWGALHARAHRALVQPGRVRKMHSPPPRAGRRGDTECLDGGVCRLWPSHTTDCVGLREHAGSQTLATTHRTVTTGRSVTEATAGGLTGMVPLMCNVQNRQLYRQKAEVCPLRPGAG